MLVWRVNGFLFMGGRWMKWWNLGGGNSNIFDFQPYKLGDDPIWRAYFSDGLVQPPTRNVHNFFLSRPDTFASRTAALQVGLAVGLERKGLMKLPWLHDLRTLRIDIDWSYDINVFILHVFTVHFIVLFLLYIQIHYIVYTSLRPIF